MATIRSRQRPPHLQNEAASEVSPKVRPENREARPIQARPYQETPETSPAGEPAYDVGKNKPPVSKRFGQPGGNRPGRKPGARSLAAQVKREFRTYVYLPQKNGPRLRMTRSEVTANTLANEAAKGNVRILEFLVRHGVIDLTDTDEPTATNVDIDLDDEGLAALRTLLGLPEDAPSPSPEAGAEGAEGAEGEEGEEEDAS